MNENFKWFAAAVAVVGLSIGAVIYISWKDQEAPPAKPVAAVPAPVAVPDDDTAKHPVPPSDAQEPLPPLNESDVPIQDALMDLFGKDSVERIFNPQDLVRHFVVSVDNLPEQKVAERIRPVKPVPGKFQVSGSEEAPVLDPANYERYKPMVQMIQAIDAKRLVASYARYYPLFQEAYESLGHPPKYFNDRLVEVIDHLLTTPDVLDPIVLARPNVQYEFADSKLESLAAGQKVLIRMGSANATAVKAKLRELRRELLALPKN
jgi:hypothetical protein